MKCYEVFDLVSISPLTDKLPIHLPYFKPHFPTYKKSAADDYENHLCKNMENLNYNYFLKSKTLRQIKRKLMMYNISFCTNILKVVCCRYAKMRL